MLDCYSDKHGAGRFVRSSTVAISWVTASHRSHFYISVGCWWGVASCWPIRRDKRFAAWGLTWNSDTTHGWQWAECICFLVINYCEGKRLWQWRSVRGTLSSRVQAIVNLSLVWRNNWSLITARLDGIWLSSTWVFSLLTLRYISQSCWEARHDRSLLGEEHVAGRRGACWRTCGNDAIIFERWSLQTEEMKDCRVVH